MDESQGSDRKLPVSSPFVVEPSSCHTHSVILLHGLGSNGEKFGKELLETGVSSNGKKLTEVLSGARFIFPTSKRRRSSAFHRARLTQWFNVASLEDPSHRSHTQVQGLEESSREILDLIDQESGKVPRKNIILGGLSQGCAMALICLLAMDFSVGGFIGMSGWLPYRNEIEELAKADDEDESEDDPFSSDDDNPFATSGDSECEAQDPVAKVRTFVRDLLSLGDLRTLSSEESAISTPIFLGHGDADEKINPSLGEDASQILSSVGFQVDWRRYAGQGHWYKIPDEIDDIVEFIQTKAMWKMGAA
ncbi:hypothetical protein CDV31_016846 [Fusarium ambrosium]|uniref:Phospholipase/carboxylesterase/thioesterase domain-containing protein n=1 Tax=Fusarium ambrosium TaxID=131363 RepID=A0A428S0U3_9HYPO|nr:hypothetical protein CDV31_016846 [Fusarium ambrosium]